MRSGSTSPTSVKSPCASRKGVLPRAKDSRLNQLNSPLTCLPPSTILIGRPIGAHHLLGRVDLERVAQRGQQVGNRDGVVLDLGAVGIGGADDLAALDAAAGQRDVEDLGEVVAAGVGVDLGGAAELAHPDDQCLIEHARAASGR